MEISCLRTKGLHPDQHFIILKAISYSWRASLSSPGELFYLSTDFLFLPIECCPCSEGPCLSPRGAKFRSRNSYPGISQSRFPPWFQVLLVWRGGDQPFALHCSLHPRSAGSHLRDRHLCPFPCGARGTFVSLTLGSLLPLHRLLQNIYSFWNHRKLEQRNDHENLIFCSLVYLIILQLGFKGLNYLSCFIRFITTFCTVPPAPQRE